MVLGTIAMQGYEISKVGVDGKSMTVVTKFGDDPELHENWLFIAIGSNAQSRRAAKRWIGANVYTMTYYRSALDRFREFQEFINRRAAETRVKRISESTVERTRIATRIASRT